MASYDSAFSLKTLQLYLPWLVEVKVWIKKGGTALVFFLISPLMGQFVLTGNTGNFGSIAGTAVLNEDFLRFLLVHSGSECHCAT